MLTIGPFGIFLNNEIPHKLLCDVSQEGGWGSQENVTVNSRLAVQSPDKLVRKVHCQAQIVL